MEFSQDPEASRGFADSLLPTCALVLFVLPRGTPNQEEAGNTYELEVYHFVVCLWLSNLFSWSLIKGDIKDSQYKYHLLNEATKVKSVETACSLVSAQLVHGDWEARRGC